MKKFVILPIVYCFLSVIALNGQMYQGDFLIGTSSRLGVVGNGTNLVSIGVSTMSYKSDAEGFEESDPDKLVMFNLSPKVGFFVADNFLLGIDLTISNQSYTEGTDNDKMIQTVFFGGPFIRYYIPTGKIMPFFELGGAYGVSNIKVDYSDYPSDDFKESISNFGGGAGMAILITSKVSFDLKIDYNRLTAKDTEDNDDNYRTVNGTLGINFGFNIVL